MIMSLLVGVLVLDDIDTFTDLGLEYTFAELGLELVGAGRS